MTLATVGVVAVLAVRDLDRKPVAHIVGDGDGLVGVAHEGIAAVCAACHGSDPGVAVLGLVVLVADSGDAAGVEEVALAVYVGADGLAAGRGGTLVSGNQVRGDGDREEMLPVPAGV